MEHPTSSISLGDDDTFDLEGPLVIRHCYNDSVYPIALEGVTQGGHEVNISLTQGDVAALQEAFNLFGI